MQILKDKNIHDINQYISKLGVHSHKYSFIYFEFSSLKPHMTTPIQMKIVISQIMEMCKFYDGFVFQMPNNDIIILIFTNNFQIIKKIEFNVKYILSGNKFNEPINENFCKIHNIVGEFDKINSILSNIKQKKACKIHAQPELDDIIAKLSDIDISKYISIQQIFLRNDGKFYPAFSEVYSSIPRVMKDCGIEKYMRSFPEKILFNIMFHYLDIAVLKFIASNKEQYLSHPISINLCLDTISSDFFAEFISEIGNDNATKIMVELAYSDIILDINLYKIAKSIIHQNNMKISIDGLNSYTFLLYDNEFIGADLVKMQWNQDICSSMDSKENNKLLSKIQQISASKIILTRCENEDAIKYGENLGIRIFQGWHIGV